MGYGQPDVYYQPEHFDLRIVAEVDYADSYEFDMRVVWEHLPTGRLLTARDAGCSCPSPFEDYLALSDLDDLDYTMLVSEIRKQTSGRGISASEGMQFLGTVRNAWQRLTK